jgi:predicted MFS family arabinose efflux permease
LTIDAVGTLLLFAALTTLLIPPIQGGDAGWPWWCFALLLASLGSGAVFWAHQRRRAMRVGSALIAPELLAERCFSLGLVTTLFFATASTGFLLTFSLTLQHGLGYSPLDTALLHMPFGLGVMAGISRIGRKMLPRFGKRVPIVGAAIMAPSCVGVAVAASVAAGPLPLSILLIVAGIGMGTLAGPMPPITLARVDRGHAGVAGAMHKATQQVGGALGGAVIGTLYFQAIGSGAEAELFRNAFPLASVAVAALLVGASTALAGLPSDIFVVRKKA